MEFTQGILATIILFAGCVLQSTIGFGAGTFSVPLLLWIDMDLPAAIAIVNVVALVQAIWSCVRNNGETPWRRTVPMQLIRLGGMSFGVWVLIWLVHFRPDRIKQVIGGVLLLILFMQLTLKTKPREFVHPGWTLLAGSISGFLLGVVGMGGPALALWVMAHNWTNRQIRGFMWATFIVVVPFMLLLLLWRFPQQVAPAVVVGLLASPITLAGTEVGLRLGTLLSIRRLRLAIYMTLFVIAIASIVGPTFYSTR